MHRTHEARGRVAEPTRQLFGARAGEEMEMADEEGGEKVGVAETGHMEPGNEAVDEAMSPTIPEYTRSGQSQTNGSTRSETTSDRVIKEASCEKNRRASEKGADTPTEAVGGPPRDHEENHGATESPNVSNACTDHEEATTELRGDASVTIGSTGAGEQYPYRECLERS